MNALEDQVREFCVPCLDPLVDAERFDFVADLGAEMPMRVIGMLLGIPDSDQATVRDQSDATCGPSRASRWSCSEDSDRQRRDLRRVRRLARRAPVRRPDDGAAQRRVRGRARHDAHPDPRRGAHVHAGPRRGGQRDHRSADRLAREGARRAPRPAPRDRRRPVADPERDRGAAALRAHRAPRRPVRRRATSSTTARPSPKAARCCCWSAPANRDERRYEDPDRFDIHRDQGQHLTFGFGLHFCLGAALARLEGRVALDEVLNRFPDWELDLDSRAARADVHCAGLGLHARHRRLIYPFSAGPS